MKSLRPWIGGLCVFAAAFLVYSNSIDDGFVWDDHVQVEANSFLRDSQSIRKIFSPSFFTKVVPVRGGGRPLVVLSFIADRAVWGEEAGGFHLTNVFLHGASSIAFYALALEFLPVGPALVAGLLFAVHPIHTETVGVVSFRGDLLAALFSFLGLWGYIRLSSKKGWLSLLWGVVAFQACYFFGLMAKEMALSLPGLALLFEWVFRRPDARTTSAQRREFWQRQALLALVPAALAGWYLVFRAPRAGFPPVLAAGLIPSEPQWAVLYHDPLSNLRTMSWVFAQYFSLMLFPYPLEIDRAPLLIDHWADGWLWSSWLVLGLLAWVAVRNGWRRRHSIIAFGLGWCFLTLIPVSNLVPIYNVMAERYLYMVSAGACFVLAGVLDRIESRRLAATIASVLIGVFSAMTFVRNRAYLDDRTLFSPESKRFVDSARLHCNRGVLFEREGDPVAAVGELRRALAIHPRYVEAKIALGTAYDDLGLTDQALESYREGAELGPRYAVPYFLLAEALRRRHHPEESREEYIQALKLDPRLAMAHVGLGLCWLDLKKDDDAAREFRAALDLQPDLPSAHYALGNVLAQQSLWSEAAEEFKRAAVLDPWGTDVAVRLAYCYRKTGRLVAARRWLARAKRSG